MSSHKSIEFDAEVEIYLKDNTKNTFKTKVIITSNNDFDRRLEFNIPQSPDIMSPEKNELPEKINLEGSYKSYQIIGENICCCRIIDGASGIKYYCLVDGIKFVNCNYNKNEIDYWKIEFFGVNLNSETIRREGFEFGFSKTIYEPFSRIEAQQFNFKIPNNKKYDFINDDKYVYSLENILTIFSGAEVCSGNIKGYNRNDECVMAKLKTPEFVFERENRHFKGYIELKEFVGVLSKLEMFVKHNFLFRYYSNIFFQKYLQFRLAFAYQTIEYIFKNFWNKKGVCKSCKIKEKIVQAFKCFDRNIIQKTAIKPEEFYDLLKQMRNSFFHGDNLDEKKAENILPEANKEYIEWYPAIAQAIVSVVMFSVLVECTLDKINAVVDY